MKEASIKCNESVAMRVTLLNMKKEEFYASDDFDDEGEFNPEFVKEVLRRIKEERSIPAEEVFRRLW